MDVYLVPVGEDRYELYCEVADEEPEEVGEPPTGMFRRLRQRFHDMLAEAERERRQGSTRVEGGWLTRAQGRLMRWVAESIAEQRLLWHLRRQTEASLFYPDDVDEQHAMARLRTSLRRDFEKHRFWLIIDSFGFVASAALMLLPGPNLLAYYFAFRLVGHYLSMRGARQGLTIVLVAHGQERAVVRPASGDRSRAGGSRRARPRRRPAAAARAPGDLRRTHGRPGSVTVESRILRVLKLKDIADRLECRLDGDGEIDIRRVTGIEDAGPGDLTFFVNPKYAAELRATKASAVILGDNAEAAPCAMLRARQPYFAFARAVELFADPWRPAPGVHRLASVSDERHRRRRRVNRTVRGRRRRRAHRRPHHRARPRDDRPSARRSATTAPSTRACRCASACGSAIAWCCRTAPSSAPTVSASPAVPKAATTRFRRSAAWSIEDDVEIGANTTIDRPAVGETRIGAGTKIDNLVQIAHGVTVGRNVLLAAQVGIAGSTTIEDDVTLAGQVGVAGHITVGKGVIATAQSGIPNSVDAGVVRVGVSGHRESRVAEVVGDLPSSAGARKRSRRSRPHRGPRIAAGRAATLATSRPTALIRSAGGASPCAIIRSPMKLRSVRLTRPLGRLWARSARWRCWRRAGGGRQPRYGRPSSITR